MPAHGQRGPDLDAVYQLMDDGPYPWETAASTITAAAAVAYCPEHVD